MIENKDPNRCSQSVFWGPWSRESQCDRKATKEGFCYQHHPDAVRKWEAANKARRKKADEASPFGRLMKAIDRIKQLEKENRKLKRIIEKGKHENNHQQS